MRSAPPTAPRQPRVSRTTSPSVVEGSELVGFEHPGFIYAVLLLTTTAIATAWLVPSPAFNRLAERSTTKAGTLQLNFYARAEADDRWSEYRLTAEQFGPALLALLAAVPDAQLPARRRPQE